MTKYDITVRFLENTKELSKCKHGKVAALLTNQNLTKIASIGINGGPAGGEDCVCGDIDAKYGCVHAETNCLIKNRDFTADTLFVTKSPCPTCAAMIVNSGYITSVYYGEAYKDTHGLEILSNAGINIKCYKEALYCTLHT